MTYSIPTDPNETWDRPNVPALRRVIVDLAYYFEGWARKSNWKERGE